MDDAEALDRLSAMTRFGINLGLQRINSLLEQFGHPEDELSIIHIGGTNGKGSTLAMLSSILREAGYRVGAYTSPHLISYCERFMINGEIIPAERLAKLLEEILTVVGKVQQATGENPTEFEVLTALAFLYFAREKVDIALIEVGLGGDIDSTNVVKKPLLSIITNVSLEHTAYLGSTLAEIAGHKGGIIKEGCPILTASKEEEVLKALRERAAFCRAPLEEIHAECRWTEQGTAEPQGKEQSRETMLNEVGRERRFGEGQILSAGQVFSVQTPRNDYRELFLPFWGRHQVENAVLAIRGAELLQEQGWRIDERVIRRGLARAVWPGRLEQIGNNPPLIIDGAHNPAGMAALANWLKGKMGKVGRVILVIGMLDDKDRRETVRLINPFVDVVIITKPQSERVKDWMELKNYFTKDKPVFVIEDLREALDKAFQEVQREAISGASQNVICEVTSKKTKKSMGNTTETIEAQDLVLVTGSLYLIGEVKELIQKRQEKTK